MATLDPNGCEKCGRLECRIRCREAYQARDRAWGAFDASKYAGHYEEPLKLAAFAATDAVNAAEKDCAKNTVNWRVLYFTLAAKGGA